MGKTRAKNLQTAEFDRKPQTQNHASSNHMSSVLRFFGWLPAMGTEPVTAGVSWQSIIGNGALCEKRRQLTLVSG